MKISRKQLIQIIKEELDINNNVSDNIKQLAKITLLIDNIKESSKLKPYKIDAQKLKLSSGNDCIQIFSHVIKLSKKKFESIVPIIKELDSDNLIKKIIPYSSAVGDSYILML